MKKFLLFLMAMGLFAIAGCSSSTDSNTTDPGDGNKGECKNPVLSEIDLTGQPFSLLGVYEVSLYGKNDEPTDTPSQKSELRVGLNLSTSQSGNPEVLMSLDFEGKKMTFDNHPINLSNAGGDLNAFISKTFKGLGAELIDSDKYGLLFTLDPATNKQYKAIIDNSIVNEGQFLKLKLKKIQDIEVDKGFDGSCSDQPIKPENPDNPTGPVEVTGINITTSPDNTYFKGSNVTIEFTLTPSNTTQTKVTWNNANNSKNGEVTTTSGKGSITVENVTAEDTITLTTEKGQTANYTIKVTDKLTNINFPKQSYRIEPNTTKKIEIANYEAIKGAIKSIEYSVKGKGTVEVTDSSTGKIKGLKAGNETLVATVTLPDNNTLKAECEIDVLYYVDFNEIETLKGTYQIEFFASVAALTGGASSNWKVIDSYKNVLEETTSMSKPKIAAADAEGNIFGKATITLESDTLKIASKLQMKNDSFSTGMLASQLKPQQYNYTEYTPIPVANINKKNNTINKDAGTPVNGVTGRDAVNRKPDSIANNQKDANTYYFKLHTDGKLYNYMVDNSVMSGTKVLVVLSKINNSIDTLDPNVQFTNEEAGGKDLQLDDIFQGTPKKALLLNYN